MDKNVNIAVVCVKTGEKYTISDVLKLKKATDKYLTIPHDFICLTDNKDGLDEIDYILIDPVCESTNHPTKPSKGFWNKLLIFKQNLLPDYYKILYLDLDLVIVDNIDCLFRFEQSFVSIRDWHIIAEVINSSVMLFNVNELHYLYESFAYRSAKIMSSFYGDQEYISAYIREKYYFPKEWILSYKHSKLDKIEDIKEVKDCKIVVFHGNPKPKNVKNKWVIDYYEQI